MRVLVVPELYRPDDASANGTLNDLVTLVGEWLRIDPTLHVYWLLPPRESAGYERADVHADRERVTLIEAEPYLSGLDRSERFTENGYSAGQLRALRDRVAGEDAYLDAVVDQLRTGRFVLSKLLLDETDQWAAEVRPFDVVADVHDLQLPFKYRYCSYRDEFQSRMEAAAATFADGIWFKAGADRRRMREYAKGFLDADSVDSALDDSVETGSPIDLSGFDATFADGADTFHLAGSFWEKKHADLLFDVGRRLRDRFGIGTIVTSMEPVPERYRAEPWVEAHGEASRETYERALAEGDLAVCASEYETMARTPFEQAASGQVLILRDEPWIYDGVPDGYPLVGPPDALADLAVAAVDHWEEAVAAAGRLVEHVREVRSPERAGERTYADLRGRVDRKSAAYDGGKRRAVVERTLGGATPPVPLDELEARTAAHTDDGRPLSEREDYARIDLIYTLRTLGWVDTGNPGTPAFAPVDAPSGGHDRATAGPGPAAGGRGGGDGTGGER